ncbi:hypothetical protein [Falsibacillus pallidus]|uniref:Pilus assembly protein Flp/PilA n=1 Tax=Falsibacillus pallidus TaxID=493781 RepID=A0A370G7E7_9BACI|nr:hypothetical protein [Falsibacillus pallidus]RDI37943.1 hypothetical protein DFR59_12041 [Falsibacillus pallidus]
MNKLTELYVKASIKVQEMIRNEKGSQTLEWIGIAAVVVIVVGIISTAFSNNNEFGNKVVEKFNSLIGQIGGN